jgi:hypothetical protein
MQQNLRRRAALFGGVLSSVVMGVASAGSSAAPNGVINGCVGPLMGGLRVPSTGTCRSSETPLSWNQQGVQGPQGAPGAQGPAGADGTVGWFDSASQYGITPTNGYGEDWGSWHGGSTLSKIDLPAGSFIVTARGVAMTDNSNGARVKCYLRSGSTNFDLSYTNLSGAADHRTLFLNGPLTLAQPGTVSLVCSTETGSTSLWNGALSVTQVGTLHVSTTPPQG